MADVKPFIGVRYAVSSGADVSDRLAPPYDVIDAQYRADLASRSDHNVVLMDLPEHPSGGNKYDHAGALYRQWLDSGVLVRDTEPSFTIYHQTFPGPDGNMTTRKGLIAGVRLEEFDAGVILPHEYTLQGPKEDRMNLFQSCGATASQVFCVYDDPGFVVDTLLSRATTGTPLMTATSDDGVQHAIWRTTDPEIVAGVSAFFTDKSLLIADGHHRYETGLHYRNEQQKRLGKDDVPATYYAIYLANMADEGTVVYPIHRLVRDVEGFTASSFVEGLKEFFELRPLTGTTLEELKAGIEEHRKDAVSHVYGAILPNGGGWSFSLRPDALEAGLGVIDEQEPLRSLDVTVLHSLVLDRVLGITKEKLAAQTNVDYIKAEPTFLTKLGSGAYQIGFLLPAPEPRKVATVAAAGMRMPQKSTYFYPKILSGVVTYPLEG